MNGKKIYNNEPTYGYYVTREIRKNDVLFVVGLLKAGEHAGWAYIRVDSMMYRPEYPGGEYIGRRINRSSFLVDSNDIAKVLRRDICSWDRRFSLLSEGDISTLLDDYKGLCD